MSKYAESDIPGIFRKLRAKDVLIRSYAGGYPYARNGLLMRSSISEPIYSYGKNFEKFGKEFSIFMWTTEKDRTRVENHFDKVVKGLKREQIIEVVNNIRSFAYVTPVYDSHN